MKLVDKLIIHMEWMESNGAVIKTKSSSKILMSYYMSLGVTNNTTMTEWLMGIGHKKYPAYGSVSRAIRKAREVNPQWKKNAQQVEDEVSTVKEEVGYVSTQQ